MKTVLIFALGGLAALSSAQALRLDSTQDWSFDYSGHYAFAGLSTGGNATLTALLSTTLGGQLSLLQGDMTGSQTVSIGQSGANVATSPLSFTANPPAGLVSGLGGFLFNVLNTSTGAYTGTVTGPSLALHGPSVADVLGTIGLGGLSLVRRRRRAR